MTLDRFLSASLTVAALAIAAAVVHREFFRPPAAAADDMTPVLLKDWKGPGDAGIVMGDTTAPVQLVEFIDFECPVCKGFEVRLRQVMARFGNKVARTLVHYPLQGHPMAQPAARAAECGHAQQKFDEVMQLLYAKQDSFGVKSWVSFGKDAQVADSAAFRKCTQSTEPVQRIDAGLALARKLDLRGTPTVILNGWQFNGQLTDSMLTHTIEDLLSKRKPRLAK